MSAGTRGGAVMKHMILRAGEHFPAGHSGIDLREPIFTAVMHRHVTTNLFVTRAPKQLHPAGNRVFGITLATLPLAVRSLVNESTGDAQARIAIEPAENAFVIIVAFKGDVRVEDAHEIELLIFGQR